MERVKRILVATDASGQGRRAHARAAMLGVELKAETLEIMEVRQTRLGLGTAATATRSNVIAHDAISALMHNDSPIPAAPHEADGPGCIRSLRVGKPPAAIAAQAAERRADLTVVAARASNLFFGLLGGTDNEELVRGCSRPLLLVNTQPREGYKKILVAIDFSDESREAARMALLMSPSAHATFIHAFHVPGEGMMREAGISEDAIAAYRLRASETARGELNRMIAELGPKKQLIARAIQHGHPVPVICNYAKRIGADLIAVGKHGKSRLQEFLLGSVTQQLLSRAPCDLLITPAPDEDDWRPPPAA